MLLCLYFWQWSVLYCLQWLFWYYWIYKWFFLRWSVAEGPVWVLLFDFFLVSEKWQRLWSSWFLQLFSVLSQWYSSSVRFSVLWLLWPFHFWFLPGSCRFRCFFRKLLQYSYCWISRIRWNLLLQVLKLSEVLFSGWFSGGCCLCLLLWMVSVYFRNFLSLFCHRCCICGSVLPVPGQ